MSRAPSIDLNAIHRTDGKAEQPHNDAERDWRAIRHDRYDNPLSRSKAGCHWRRDACQAIAQPVAGTVFADKPAACVCRPDCASLQAQHLDIAADRLRSQPAQPGCNGNGGTGMRRERVYIDPNAMAEKYRAMAPMVLNHSTKACAVCRKTRSMGQYAAGDDHCATCRRRA